MVALPGFLSKLFDSNARDIEKYRAVVIKINALEAQFEKLSDDQLRAKTDELRERVQKEYRTKLAEAEPTWIMLIDQKRREEERKIYDPILDAVLPEAFAMVREASKRTLGMRHFDVQLIGGMALHDGRIAEMRTGEGKTLVATAPLYLNALLGKGVHLVTANDYLSKRDAVWNSPVYHLLGMSVGIIQGQSPETGDEGGSYIYDPDYEDPDPGHAYARPISRHEAYMCDITYGTNNEYGFDYLRDNMEFSAEELRQRALHYAIVDEVDSILIDEARTPLIISGMVQESTDKYYFIDTIVSLMKKGIDDPKADKDNPDADKLNPKIHYVVDEKQKTATITDAGVDFVEKKLKEKLPGNPDVNLSEAHDMMHYLQASLKAHGVFRKDIDYVVKASNEEDGPEIIIVDENTGRLMFGRRYSDGLHQAIEAKEKVKVKNESQTLATITFQNYFRLYSKLGGMTGTAKTEEDEFRKIYALDVVQVPTNKPIQRSDRPDIIYKNEEHKLRGIAAEILRIYCKQQPVLVGTRSIEMSERVSARLAPGALATITFTEFLREKAETTKGITAEKKKEYANLFNQSLDKLSVARLKNVAKDLGVSEDPLAPDNMNGIARLFEVTDAGLDFLEDALTHGIGHNILNAKYHEKEALIIAEAGRKGAVTIATNMAGRGVDILLGGKHIKQELPPVDGTLKSLKRAETVAEESEHESSIEEEPSHRRFGKASVLDAVTTGALTTEEHKQAADVVRSLGGLFILGTERHESRRIDNQLRGRAGRQGDPGESRFFVSLEDELWRLFGDRTSSPLFKAWEDHLAMDAKLLSKAVERAQKKIEEHYFESRKHVLNYDDVMNRQRELIYKERRRILQGVDLKETIFHYIRENIEAAVKVYTRTDMQQNEWDIETLYSELNDYFMLFPVVTVEDLKGKSRDEMIAYLTNHVLKVYQSREDEMEEMQGPGAMRQLERWMALRAVNDRWMEHLANMDYLREGIGLRGYEQKDPLLIYQKEAFDEFEKMQQAIQDDIVRNLFRMQVVAEPQQPIRQELPPNVAPAIPLPTDLPKPKTKFAPIADLGELDTPRNIITNRDPEPSGAKSGGNLRRDDGAPADWKGGRNDPCWCGSGNKYKKCHGK